MILGVVITLITAGLDKDQSKKEKDKSKKGIQFC